MQLTSTSFPNGGPIPADFAFVQPIPDPEHVMLAENRNPQFAWSGAPEGTRAFALICHDPDVPGTPEGVNEEGAVVERDRPRVDFYHWVVVGIAADQASLSEGGFSVGVTPGGKACGRTALGLIGKNDYTAWFAGDPDMQGDYGGYDGPGPPWNDERLHHYHFTIYALDTETFDLPESGDFTGGDALAAIEGHVLDQASWVGTYTTNPDGVKP